MQWDVEVQGLPLRKHLLENDQHGVWQGTPSPRCCPPSRISTFVLLTSHEFITGVSSCKVAQALSWPRESRECPLNARVLSLKLPYRSKTSRPVQWPRQYSPGSADHQSRYWMARAMCVKAAGDNNPPTNAPARLFVLSPTHLSSPRPPKHRTTSSSIRPQAHQMSTTRHCFSSRRMTREESCTPGSQQLPIQLPRQHPPVRRKHHN